MKRYLISGGTGLIGQALKSHLESSGHEVRVLSRRKTDASNGVFHWNVDSGELDLKAFESIDYLINLAGAGVIDKAWTVAYKTEILESRLKSSRLLQKVISENKISLKSVACASAIGFYGDRDSEEILTEESATGTGYLAAVCSNWEEVNKGFEQLGIPTQVLRIGIVLSNKGGALKPLIPLTKAFLSAPLGNGKQVVSWVHILDLVRMIEFVLEKRESATYNAVGPSPVTNKVYTKAIGKALKRPILFPFVPVFAIKLIFGERSDAILMSSNVQAKKALSAGFEFRFKKIYEALSDLLS